MRACAHCNLPITRAAVAVTIDATLQEFCCYGCALAMQITRASGEGGTASLILVRLGLAVFFTMNLMMVTMPTYAPYVYGLDGRADGPMFDLLRWLGAALSAPVIILLGGPIVLSVRLQAGGRWNTDLLVAVGAAAAYALSFVNLWSGAGPVYFDTAAMLLVFLTLGRYLEARAKADAGTLIDKHIKPTPDLARRLLPFGEEQVDPQQLRVGDLVLVGPGTAFPTDGEIGQGCGGVDESQLTGESSPVLKQIGDAVAGGTCSVDGAFHVRVTRILADSTAAQISRLFQQARGERAPIERLADRVSGWMTPLVLLLAAGSGVYWGVHRDVQTGLLNALAVLVVACPCGLGIAVPVALWSGLGQALRRGILLRSADRLERLSQVQRIFFDKTGTLTESRLTLQRVEPLSQRCPSVDAVLQSIASLEDCVSHPIARALKAAAAERQLPLLPVEDLVVEAGRGVSGRVDTQWLSVGRDDSGDRSEDGPVVLLRDSIGPLARLSLTETVRLETPEVVRQLRALGLDLALMTGDRQARGLCPGLFSVDETHMRLMPQDKLEILRRSGSLGTAMVGDGVNDAPALGQASVGIAVQGASDLTRLAADVVVLGDDLRRIPWAIEHARRVMRVCRQNLIWVFAYNSIAVALAVLGWLNPVVASLAMLANSLAVVLNARRLGGAPHTLDSTAGVAVQPLHPQGALLALRPRPQTTPAWRVHELSAPSPTSSGISKRGSGQDK